MLKIILIFLLIKLMLNMMVFPFKQAFVNKNGNITIDSKEYNGSNFAKDYFNMKLYTEVKIGNPYQKVKVLLSGEACAFKIGKSKNCIYSNEYLSYYNRNSSQDFNYTDVNSMVDSEFYDERGSTAEDTIYAYTDINLKKEISFKNVGFYLGSDTNDKLCGIIGLEMDNIFCERIINIIKDCKSKNYINNRKFILKYNNSINEGLFIIGSELKYIIDNYEEIKIFSVKLTNRIKQYRFGFEISKAIIGENNFTVNTNLPGEINNDCSFIIAGPQYFENFSSLFFEKYFKKGICNINIYDNDPSLALSEKYSVIECDKGKFGEKDLKEFPNFYLFISNYFEEKRIFFDYKDLFTETKYKYFFNIIFDNSVRSRIELGKIFLKKYHVNFDFDNKILEIYDFYEKKSNNENKEGKNDNENESKTVLYIIIIIILVAITGILGYFLGKYLNKIRKKRANELADDYDYQTESPLKPNSSINT